MQNDNKQCWSAKTLTWGRVSKIFPSFCRVLRKTQKLMCSKWWRMFRLTLTLTLTSTIDIDSYGQASSTVVKMQFQCAATIQLSHLILIFIFPIIFIFIFCWFSFSWERKSVKNWWEQSFDFWVEWKRESRAFLGYAFWLEFSTRQEVATICCINLFS